MPIFLVDNLLNKVHLYIALIYPDSPWAYCCYLVCTFDFYQFTVLSYPPFHLFAKNVSLKKYLFCLVFRFSRLNWIHFSLQEMELDFLVLNLGLAFELLIALVVAVMPWTLLSNLHSYWSRFKCRQSKTAT